MTNAVFWFFAVLAVASAALCIVQRNPVSAALWLVSTMFSLAAIYVLLNAQFIAAIQVLVYAGAVMVLFLFIIMLLNLQAEARRPINWLAAVGGSAVAVILLIQIVRIIGNVQAAQQTFPLVASSTTDDVRNVGALLFRDYNLPFQIIGVLVLVATIGVVLLSKREPRG